MPYWVGTGFPELLKINIILFVNYENSSLLMLVSTNLMLSSNNYNKFYHDVNFYPSHLHWPAVSPKYQLTDSNFSHVEIIIFSPVSSPVHC